MRRKLKLISSLTAPSIKSYVFAVVFLFIASAGVSIWTWQNAHRNLVSSIETDLQNGVDGAKELVVSKIGTYAEILNGAAGLFKAIEVVDQRAWSQYVGNLQVQQRYPGLQAVVYSEVVSPLDINQYIQSRQSDTDPAYNLRPSGERDIYVPVRLIEPLSEENAQVRGFDPYTEELRRRAMDQARDTGKLSITSRLVLVPDQNNSKPSPGFIIFVPVYANNTPIDNINERRAALIGFVSAGVRSYDLIDGLLGRAITKDTAVRVYDGEKLDDKNLVYESNTYPSLSKQEGIISKQTVIKAGNNTWTLVGYVNSNVASTAERSQPRLLLIVGLVFSFIISLGLLYVMITRARHIAREKNKEVQDAKDSLISLASHQLRTPATGVKQFIGMVIEGYAGEITKEQRKMLNKAYQSNERQLEIINQILHVTRADSGRLELHKEQIDLNEIIRTVISEHAQPIQARNQKVIFNGGRNSLLIKADRQYLTMAIDNLLSNASKYSHPNTIIRITTEVVGRNVIIKISDKGVGIASEDRHLLFQKFSRIDNELSIEAGGNGIGLYLCREIITQHRGTIEVESRPGKGSMFIISMPKS